MIVRHLLLLLAASVVLALPATASADVITIHAPATAPGAGNGGPRQVDLDHHRAYTWRIDNMNVPRGHTIAGATLSFHNISNWDSNPNMLFIHLLDTAKNAGISSFADATGVPVPIWEIRDNFAGTLLGNNPLVTAGTGNILLTQQSFHTLPRDFVYTFTADQLSVLSAFFLNGSNIAFGLDPDCHFWNNGITLTLNTCPPTATPEPATLALLGSGLAGMYYRRRQRKKKAAAAALEN